MDKKQIKEALKPLADGLFGKQRTSRYERPHFVIRPISMMLEDLVQLDDVSWGKYAFSREPLKNKFSEEQKSELTLKSIACGVEYAQKYVEKYGKADPSRLADKMGMNVQYPEMPQNTDRVLFAEYKAPNNINIFMDGVKKAYETLKEPGVEAALGEGLNVSKTLLAHELFHFVEEENAKTIFTHTEKVELWAPKPLHNRSGIAVLGEIAAMAFAKELVGLSFSPYVMDVLLVYGYNPEEASGLYEEIMELAGKTPRLPENDDLVSGDVSTEEISTEE